VRRTAAAAAAAAQLLEAESTTVNFNYSDASRRQSIYTAAVRRLDCIHLSDVRQDNAEHTAFTGHVIIRLLSSWHPVISDADITYCLTTSMPAEK